MDNFQVRVIEEKADLDTKLEKLCVFTRGGIFANLPTMEQERLNMQKHLMLAYSAVLGERIQNFKSDFHNQSVATALKPLTPEQLATLSNHTPSYGCQKCGSPVVGFHHRVCPENNR